MQLVLLRITLVLMGLIAFIFGVFLFWAVYLAFGGGLYQKIQVISMITFGFATLVSGFTLKSSSRKLIYFAMISSSLVVLFSPFTDLLIKQPDDFFAIYTLIIAFQIFLILKLNQVKQIIPMQ